MLGLAIDDVIKILTFAFSLLGTALGAFATFVAKRAKMEASGKNNTEDIKAVNVRLDAVEADGILLGKEGERVHIRLVGISGDNGLVHDIIKLKNDMSALQGTVRVLSDRAGVD